MEHIKTSELATTTQNALSALNSQEAADVIANIHGMLVDIPVETLPKIPEDVFVGYFLPYFSGAKPIQEEDTVLADWIKIVGSPGQRAVIIGKDKQILFKVPPLFDSNVIDVRSSLPGESIKEILNNSNLHGNNIPAAGQRVLMEGLKNKFIHSVKESEQRPAYVDEWNAIFTRYNMWPNIEGSSTLVKEDREDLSYD